MEDKKTESGGQSELRGAWKWLLFLPPFVAFGYVYDFLIDPQGGYGLERYLLSPILDALCMSVLCWFLFLPFLAAIVAHVVRRSETAYWVAHAILITTLAVIGFLCVLFNVGSCPKLVN